MTVNINIWWLIVIAILCLFSGVGITLWYISTTLKKTLGIKSWKEFLNQVKKQQELSKKMEGKGLKEMLNDPDLKKQIEQFREKFK